MERLDPEGLRGLPRRDLELPLQGAAPRYLSKKLSGFLLSGFAHFGRCSVAFWVEPHGPDGPPIAGFSGPALGI